MNELVSIVVPIYNTEQYISKCIESLINQTYKNLEIILIDDGSTDNSFNICKKYQKEDERIKLFHKENGGVSSARNYGIKKATGEYICFCDSDDYYSLEALTIMTDTIRDSNADLCCFGRYGGSFENKYISKRENPLELLNYLSYIHIIHLKNSTRSIEFLFQVYHFSAYVIKQSLSFFPFFQLYSSD